MLKIVLGVALLQGLVVDAQIACESGSIEGDSGLCIAVSSNDCDADDVTSLDTINPPSLLEGQVGGSGALTLQVRHGLTRNRVVDAIVLNDEFAECNYPGPFWTKLVGGTDDECIDAYNSTVPWSVAGSNCGLVRTDDDDFMYLTGLAEVRMTEQLSSLRGQSIERTIVSALEFRVGFAKRATVSTLDVVYDDARLLAAVTALEWNSEAGFADLDVTVSLQKPFKVQRWSIDSTPDGVTALEGDSGLFPSQDCESQSGDQDCLQVWRATVTPNATTCFIGGDYQVSVVLGCQDGVADADCPFFGVSEEDATRRIDVQMLLDSENLCARVEELVGVNLQLDSHVSFEPLSFDFGPIKDAFFQDQEMYYDLRINAERNFDLESTSILECLVGDASGTDVTVYDASAGATAGWAWATLFNAQSSPTSHQHEFEFVPAEAVFGEVPLDGSVETRVTVTVAVVFANTGTRKRFTLQSTESQPTPAEADVSTNVGVLPAESQDDPPVSDDDDIENTGIELDDWLIPVCIALSVASCCCMLIFGFITRRRTKEEDIRPMVKKIMQEMKPISV